MKHANRIIRYYYSKTVLRTSVVMLCLLPVVSCVTLVQPLELGVSEGIAVVNLVNNSPRIYQHSQEESIIVRVASIDYVDQYMQKAQYSLYSADSLLQERSKLHLLRVLASNETSSLHMGNLPSGDYVIVDLLVTRTFGNGNTKMYTIPAGAHIGTFKIRENHYTNLGNLIIQQLDNRKRSIVLFRDNHKLGSNVSEYIKTHHGKIHHAIAKNPTLGWTDDAQTSNRKQLLHFANKNVYPFASVFLRQDGVDVLICSMNSILWRDSKDNSEQWNLAQIGEPDFGELSYIAKLGDYFVATSTTGQLYYTNSLEKDWTPIQPVKFDENIVFIGMGRENNYALTFQEKDKKIFTTYRFASLQSPWIKIGEIQTHSDTMRKYMGDMHSMDVTAFITDSGEFVIAGGTLKKYNSADDSWRNYSDEQVGLIRQLKNGYISGVRFVDGKLSHPAISLTSGRSWIDIKTKISKYDNYSSLIRNSGYVLGENQFASIGRLGIKSKKVFENDYFTELGVVSLDDQSKPNDLKISGSIPENCDKSAASISRDEKLYILCSNGSLRFSEDLGKKWQYSFKYSGMNEKAFLQSIKSISQND